MIIKRFILSSHLHYLMIWAAMIIFHAAISFGKNIEDLTHHFDKLDQDIQPWMFVPQSNVKDINTSLLPGAVSIREAGAGKDIKGILVEPIRINEFPLPWYFQLALMQNQNAVAGHTGSGTQINYAIGLNLAVTFSDPAVWPKDRTQRPPDTHDVQLFIVHLGASGEVTLGLPQYTTDIHPEKWLVWGRGDLGYTAMGDWQIPYIQIGNGIKEAGPANSQIYFQCQVNSPTQIGIGIKFNPYQDFTMRWIDFAGMYGPATGIWEIGPIFSCDRWIPDVLCRSIPIVRGPAPLLLGTTKNDKESNANWVAIPMPYPEKPLPQLEYLVDYCAFGSFATTDLESFSTDFDVLGYLGKGRFQLYASKMDTFSHPGYLTWTKMGKSLECFAWATPGVMDFEDFKPPWEIETCITPPEDAYNWDFDFGVGFLDDKNKDVGIWYPGVRNLPRSKRHEYFTFGDPGYKIKFDPPIPEKILSSKPIYMLIQFIDRSHVRLGFKSKAQDPWYLSKICEWSGGNGKAIQKLLFVAWNASTSTPPDGEFVGFPMYQQYLYDYIHYRYGLSTEQSQPGKRR
jgi:hypothetical protein